MLRLKSPPTAFCWAPGLSLQVQGISLILVPARGYLLSWLHSVLRHNIVAIEPDPGAYMQAGLNISDSPWHERITLINTRVQDYFPEAGLLFDAVITNPPFFVDSLPNPDPGKAMARHSLTLSFRELLEAAIRLMVPSGTLHLVLPVNEAGHFIEMAGSLGLYCQRKLNVRPAPETPPSRVLMTLGYSQGNVEESTIVIEKGGRHNYSDEYVSLTKDFYLKF